MNHESTTAQDSSENDDSIICCAKFEFMKMGPAYSSTITSSIHSYRQFISPTESGKEQGNGKRNKCFRSSNHSPAKMCTSGQLSFP